MKKVLILGMIAIIACNTPKKQDNKVDETLRAYYKAEISDLKSIDTLTFSIDSITEKKKCNLLSLYCDYKSDEYNKYVTMSETADSVNILFYQIYPMLVYTKNNMMRYMSIGSVLIDKDYKVLSKNSIYPERLDDKFNKFNWDTLYTFPYKYIPPNVPVSDNGYIGDTSSVK